jgi:hypothetical protein
LERACHVRRAEDLVAQASLEGVADATKVAYANGVFAPLDPLADVTPGPGYPVFSDDELR